MNSRAPTLRPKPNNATSAIDALALRAWARAYLWDAGEIKTIPNAVDPLQTFAVESRLVAEIGQDAVQKILGDAFAPYRCERPSTNDAVQFCDICFCAPCFTPGFCNLCREDKEPTPTIASDHTKISRTADTADGDRGDHVLHPRTRPASFARARKHRATESMRQCGNF